ncbi:MAG: hypothetical protein HON19_06195 [Flavobacteriales bacterium]|nr:hypothetical protein [Flavobacteriales bacterium]
MRKFTTGKKIGIILLVAGVSFQCGSFQGVSYYDSDGIYNSNPAPRQNTKTAINGAPASNVANQYQQAPSQSSQQNTGYYQNYFQNLSDEYVSTPPNNEVFVDVDGYSSAQVNNQPWGSQPNNTEIYLINNRPLNPYFFGSGWGWNRFDFWRYNNPWGRYNAWGYGGNPYWGWAGYNSFYDPFWGGFYGPFPYHNPYRYYSPYAYGSRYFRNNNRFFNGFGQEQRYSRMATHRGEKGYRGSRGDRSRSDRKAAQQTKESQNTKQPRVRYNVGRNLYSIGYGRIPANLGRANRGQRAAGAAPTVTPNAVKQVAPVRVRTPRRGTTNYNGPQGTINTTGRSTNAGRSRNYNNKGDSQRSYSTSRSSSPSRSYSSPRASSGGRSTGGRSTGGRSSSGRSSGGRKNN